MQPYQTITVETLNAAKGQAGVIIDVRTAMEHDDKQLACAHMHIPLDQLQPSEFMAAQTLGKDAPIYMLCHAGKRAAQAALKFAEAGARNVHVIDGGIVACEAAGLQLKGHGVTSAQSCSTTKRPMSLERQVRIAVGCIAGSGALAALVLNPLFAFIPLVMSGGLIFAGLTDRCGLALILTKAPWNNKKA